MCLENDGIKISVIVPFYKGNQFLERLLHSIECVTYSIEIVDKIEVIIVNDSPEVDIELPDKEYHDISIITIKNEKNIGIQATRINGLNHSNSNWIIFLDQDDELDINGFKKQVYTALEGDVVVGNMLYDFGNKTQLIYKNKTQMDLYVRKENFIQLRNMIPSPGACLIKKSSIPDVWMTNILENNGADDWFLWIALYANGARFVCNEQCVYKHNDAGGRNLSYDLGKMYNSATEMLEVIKRDCVLDNKDINRLNNAVDFKYYKDTKQYTKLIRIKYAKTIFDNIIFKLRNITC